MVTVSASSAFAVRVTSLRTRGLDVAASAWSSESATDSAVTGVPSLKVALRSSKVQVVSFVCFQGLRQCGRGDAVLVQRGESFGDGQLAEHAGVVAVRRQDLHRRHGERHPQPAQGDPYLTYLDR